jgi:hypothetical protein
MMDISKLDVTYLEDVMKVIDHAGKLHWVVSLGGKLVSLDDMGEGLLRTTWGHTCFDAMDLFQYPGYSNKYHIELSHSLVAFLFPDCEEYFNDQEDIQDDCLPERLYMQLPTRPYPGEQAPLPEEQIPLPEEQIPLPEDWGKDWGMHLGQP